MAVDFDKLKSGLDQLHKRQSNTGSPALAGQPESVTGVNTQQAALAGGNTPATSLPASGSGNGGAVGGAQTPVAPTQAQTPQPGVGNQTEDPMGGVDAAQLLPDRGTPTEYLMTNLPDRVGTADTIAAVETAGVRVMGKVKDEESAAQVAAVSEQMGLTDEADIDAIKNMFGEEFKKVTEAHVQEGKITATQKKKQDKQFTKLFGGMTKEEFGLFLFEYGGIMMANGDKGLGGAAGAAGLGAFASLQERRRYAEKAEIEAQERQRKADLEERRMTLDEEKFEYEKSEAPEVRETEEGDVYYNRVTGKWEPLYSVDPETGEKKRVKKLDREGYSWQYKMQEWKNQFPWMPDEDIKLMELTGVNPLKIRNDLNARRQAILNGYQALNDNPVAQARYSVEWMSDGELKKKKYKDMTAQDWEDWYTSGIMAYGFSESAATMSPDGTSGGSALGGEGGGGDAALTPKYDGPSREDVAKSFPELGADAEDKAKADKLWADYQAEYMGK